jgi:hypothetical protein
MVFYFLRDKNLKKDEQDALLPEIDCISLSVCLGLFFFSEILATGTITHSLDFFYDKFTENSLKL